ncbi:heme oxygenase-like protein [Artomyces pyxidatus]|uniref:Heme oxygenase-like protein n=1 Tax=Artomyces pyxidatus TaxID=48021 RepID=A0ACB8T5N1_9AGAM|nr:heme oxygenase-like protein [Artomyces pyxidatus]
MAQFEDLDLSLPIATLLRDGTASAHQSVESTEGAGWLTRGELDREEYARFLIMLWSVYDTLEHALEKHASHPVLSPTYNPTLLARSASLLADISHILDIPTRDLKSSPLFVSITTAPPANLAEYTSRLKSLDDGPDPGPLLAHAYVRYLGDLSGGQFIRRRVAHAYGLEDDAGAGVAFYEFSKLGGGGSAGIGDMKKIKEWFRSGMNAGVGDDEDLKVTILAEAIKAFELNNGLFASLRAPSATPPPPPPSHLPVPQTHLGDPVTPTDPVFEEKPRELPVQILQRPEDLQRTDSLVSVSSVISFIIALCAAHFILVVGGFTGPKGWEKLEATQEWVAGLLQ